MSVRCMTSCLHNAESDVRAVLAGRDPPPDVDSGILKKRPRWLLRACRHLAPTVLSHWMVLPCSSQTPEAPNLRIVANAQKAGTDN